MDLPKQFRELRSSRGVSVYKLSKISDVSENYIHRIEKGENQPSVEILNRLLSAMGITLAEFFNENREILYPSASERELVETIRQMPQEKVDAILQIAKMMI